MQELLREIGFWMERAALTVGRLTEMQIGSIWPYHANPQRQSILRVLSECLMKDKTAVLS